MFAVIESGGKQYKVKQGDKVLLERLGAKPGETVVFDKVLLKEEDGKTEIGTPISRVRQSRSASLKKSAAKSRLYFAIIQRPGIGRKKRTAKHEPQFQLQKYK